MNGVWMKVPTHGEGIDLYYNDNYRRKYVLGRRRYLIEFSNSDEEFNEVTAFLSRNNAMWCILLFANEGVDTLYRMV